MHYPILRYTSTGRYQRLTSYLATEHALRRHVRAIAPKYSDLDFLKIEQGNELINRRLTGQWVQHS